jgi:hypothetical protein
MGALVSVVGGAVVAVLLGVGMVSAVGGDAPEPVTAPYIVYGQS